MTIKCYSYVVLAAAALLSTTARAEEPSQITVTATRLATDATEVGGSLSILTAADLERLGTPLVADALRAVPGVSVNQNGSFGGTTNVRIRGALSEQTLVLIDGVPANDTTSPGGGYDMAFLDASGIERIEVLRGPQSTLWGTDAVGGVLNIITRKPEDGFNASAFLEGGSFNTLRGGASVSGGSGPWDGLLSITGTTTDGISKADEDDGNTEEDAYDSLSVNARGGLDLPGGGRVEATLRRIASETEFDDFGVVTGTQDGNGVSEVEELSGALSARFPVLDDALLLQALVGYAEITRDNYAGAVQTFSADGDRTIVRGQATWTIDEANRVAVGLDREDTAANDEGAFLNGVFGLYEIKPVSDLTVTLGARMDDHQRYGTETTGRAAVAYDVTGAVTLRGTWSQGFKIPTIFQTTFFCCGAVAANTDLRPETSEAVEVGVDWRLWDDRLTLSTTVFHQETENLINFSFAVGGYENIAATTSRGMELAAAVDLTKSLRLDTSYTYTDATDDSTDARLVLVPMHMGFAQLAWDPDGAFSGALSVTTTGAQQDLFGDVAAWSRVDASAAYDLGEGFTLFGRVENLLDEDYQRTFGYGTPGLSGYAGLRWEM